MKLIKVRGYQLFRNNLFQSDFFGSSVSTFLDFEFRQEFNVDCSIELSIEMFFQSFINNADF